MKKIRDFNFGYLVDLSAIALLVGLYFHKTKDIPQSKYILAILLVLLVIFVLMYVFGQDTKITNKSEIMAFIKTEDNEKTEELPQNSTKYSIDGVGFDNRIYKLPNGTHAKLYGKGDVFVYSLFGKFIYFFGGGKFHLNYTDWENLYNKSKGL